MSRDVRRRSEAQFGKPRHSSPRYGGTSKAADHRANHILAALEPEDFAYLEPHLEIVDLQRGQVLYETGETVRHVYFPHDTIVSLVTLIEDGGSAETDGEARRS